MQATFLSLPANLWAKYVRMMWMICVSFQYNFVSTKVNRASILTKMEPLDKQGWWKSVTKIRHSVNGSDPTIYKTYFSFAVS